jgi:predicted RNase H-like HicB family nuclease
LRVESLTMSEIIFVVEQSPEGGFVARALGESIHTQAETVAELHARVRDAVHCHFDVGQAPKMIRLHHVRDEVIAA